MTTEVKAPPQKTSPSKRKSTTAAPQATSMGEMPKGPRLRREGYEKTVKDELRKQFSYGNVMQVPRIEKIVLNIGMGESIGNAKRMDAAANDLAIIPGQHPGVERWRKALSNFRLRVGMPIGLKVTLRGPQMWHFLEKLVTVALPRIRDFQGTPERSFDG